MRVNRHCEKALLALDSRMPVPASVILARLREAPEPASSMALEVARLQWALGTPDSSNGDTVVVIVRDGKAITAMLRRSWSQPFTPASLRVEAVATWQWKWHAPDGHNRGRGAWEAF